MTAAIVTLLAGTVAALAHRLKRFREELEAATLARDSYRLELLRAYENVDFLRACIDLPPDPHRPILHDLSRTARSQEPTP